MAPNWNLISRVRASTYRERTLLALTKPTTPATLQRQLRTISRPHITRSLRELETLGLVRLLTPRTPRYHMYERTKKGTAAAEAIRRLQ